MASCRPCELLASCIARALTVPVADLVVFVWLCVCWGGLPGTASMPFVARAGSVGRRGVAISIWLASGNVHCFFASSYSRTVRCGNVLDPAKRSNPVGANVLCTPCTGHTTSAPPMTPVQNDCCEPRSTYNVSCLRCTYSTARDPRLDPVTLTTIAQHAAPALHITPSLRRT